MDKDRPMRRVTDSLVEQVQVVLSCHINGAGRLFGGQLMEWIDVVAGVVARAIHGGIKRRQQWTACSLKSRCM